MFALKESFVKKYKDKKPPFGFNGLGEFVYLRTYSRVKEDGTNERWWETCVRVVEGTFQMQEDHINKLNLGWSEYRAQKSAQEMFARMFDMKFLPPGRGLWAMGSELTKTRGMYAALNNCGFTSTAYIDKELTEPFTFLMDASMLGIGVGFDVKGAGKLTITGGSGWGKPHVIADSREGWVESVKLLLLHYFESGHPLPVFNYSEIREAGLPIKGFGGVSSGPEPLRQLHLNIRKTLDAIIGQLITITAIVDIMNYIGVCVVAGNVRRTAEIAFGPHDSEEYRTLKDYHWDAALQKYVGSKAHRSPHGWTSNNSIFADLGMNYEEVAEQTYLNGEPGYIWLENARNYGRMADAPDFKDKRVMGANPCVEQSLEHMELCCLVETYPDNHDSLDDYKRTLKFAYLYAKTVTLGMTHWPKTNKVMARNRRIGASMSGICQFVKNRGLNELKTWCEEGYQAISEYDRKYSEWLAVPLSIKKTSIKPSGTVSLLAGATPGLHWPESRCYIRRVRVSKNSVYIARFLAAGYTVEPCVDDPSTMVVEFPVSLGSITTINEAGLWEQFAMAAFLQRYWADNQVSCTVTFDPTKVSSGEIARCLENYQYDLKGISLLPKSKDTHPQMPYEEISEEQYDYMMSQLGVLDLLGLGEQATPEVGCANDTCVLPGIPELT